MNIELLRTYNRLSPSKQRLIREMLWSLAQLEQVTVPEDHDARLDYQSYIDPWLRHLVAQGLSHHTIRHYRQLVRDFLQDYPHPKTTHIEAALADLADTGHKPGTIAFALSALKNFFTYLAERDVTTTNPAAKVHPPRVPMTIRQAPTTEQVTALLNTPKSLMHQTVLTLLIDCGIRAGELTALGIQDVHRNLITVTGKGNKTRQVPLSPSTMTLVAAHVHSLHATGYTGHWLFPGRHPDHPITGDAIRDHFEQLCRKANIPHITPHQLRHYFATQILAHGGKLKATSAMLGHAHTSTTANIYWHIIDQQEIIDQHTKFSPMQAYKALNLNKRFNTKVASNTKRIKRLKRLSGKEGAQVDNSNGWLVLQERDIIPLSVHIPSLQQITKHFVESKGRSFLCPGDDCPFCRDGIPQRIRYQAQVILNAESLTWEFGDQVYRDLKKLPSVQGWANAVVTRVGIGRRTRYQIRAQSEAKSTDDPERDKYIQGRYGHMVRR